ncbi:hypothetical protein BN59_01738 [Legionella massiliensis]|uniref:Peptidoglycan-binding protein CsiV n=1 Tax=Legionella massiliensis TaxID=1034943 RepID=A0A078KSQ9_9GAMM|nr:CsiV family protein [Legionella massiliensis]CDZ77455.1 hypothetical protein BN59_01738 [Legionella massiliensis]CEE13193.1 hypothetical protein BN1094_01738 [Legionella massiliensis]
MFKKIALVAMMLLTSLAQAAALYQIDLIVFGYQQSPISPELSLSSTLASHSANSIPLQTEISKNQTPYHLLPSSSSQLQEEYWALHRKPQYRVLIHYTWLQPFNNQSAIAIPKVQRDGWEIEGTVRVQRSNYYSLDSELLISTPSSNSAPFVLVQQQRLKGGDIYYLDHPQAGMLIKVHQVG